MNINKEQFHNKWHGLRPPTSTFKNIQHYYKNILFVLDNVELKSLKQNYRAWVRKLKSNYI